MMKRILFLLLLTVTAAAGFAQTGTTKTETLIAKYSFANERLYIPDRDTTWTPSRNGAFTQRPADGIIYHYFNVAVGPDWTPIIGGGGGGAVSSVFGRTGAVTALEADYSAFYPVLSGTYNNPSWLNQLAWSKITGAPSFLTYHLINGYTNVGGGVEFAKDTSGNKIRIRTATQGYGIDVTQLTDNVKFEVDTLEMATRARVKHVADSLAALLALPSMTGNSGKYLTNNGTVASWGTVATNADSTAARIRRGTFAQRPAVPDTGQIFEQTDRLAGTWKYDGSKWNFIPDRTKLGKFYSFSTALPANLGLGATASGTGAGHTIPQAVGYKPYLQLTTGTTSTGSVASGEAISSLSYLITDSIIRYEEYMVMIPVLSDGSQSFQVAVGHLGHQSAWNFSYCTFIYDHVTNSGNWTTRTRKYDVSGNMTSKNTGVAAVAGQWVKLAILMDGYSQKIEFFINDVLVTTHSTANGDNIPMPGAGSGFVNDQYQIGIVKSAGSTARTVLVDYYFNYWLKTKY